MSAPPLTEDRKELISNTIDTLLNSNLWHEAHLRGYVKKMKISLIVSIGVSGIAMIAALIMFYLPSFLDSYVAAFVIAIATGLIAVVSFISISVLALRNTKLSPFEPFLFYDGSNLWLLLPDDNANEDKQGQVWNKKILDRYDLIAVREQLHGPSKKMSAVQIEDMLHVANVIDEYKMGNPLEGWSLDVIEDIELIESNKENNTTKVVYTDSITGENRTLTLDSYGWREFLTWLEEQDPSTIGDDEF